MGRSSNLTPHQRQEALERRERGDTCTDIAKTYGVSQTTIMRLAAAWALYIIDRDRKSTRVSNPRAGDRVRLDDGGLQKSGATIRERRD